MRKFIVRIALATSLLCTSFFATAQEASEESIRALMNSTGMGQLGVQMIGQMIPELKKMAPDAPEKFWQDFMAEVNPDELVDLIIPVYRKHLTEEDIIALNEFYQSDVGKKLIARQPAIMQESMLAGQQWGQVLAQRVLQKYEEQKKE